MAGTSRKIAYILGAGFSYGSNHVAPVGKHKVHMPLQASLFEELCRFHYRKIKDLDKTAKAIREYFSPSTFRATRAKGSLRHRDLFRLSVEEVVTFFDEIATNKKEGWKEVETVANNLQTLTVELIGFLSTNGNPGQNSLLKKFVRRLAQTDVLITFNWDTLLDHALSNQKRFSWHKCWGYGQTVRNEFTSATRKPPPIPRKYPRLLKLHGSINWLAYRDNNATKRLIASNWDSEGRTSDVVMMPPKMIKPEVWGQVARSDPLTQIGGNKATSREFYPKLWAEAEEQLSRSKRLVFIGYSFPPADFAVSNMLRRAISAQKVEKGEFPLVDIVDPNATQLARRFEQSFNINVPIESQYLSLASYLSSARAS